MESKFWISFLSHLLSDESFSSCRGWTSGFLGLFLLLVLGNSALLFPFWAANLPVMLTLYPQTHTYSNFFPVSFLKNLLERVLCGLGHLLWPGSFDSSSSTPSVLGLQEYTATPVYMVLCFETRALHMVLYQLSHTSNSLHFKNKSLATPGFLYPFPFLSFLVRFLKGMAYKPWFQGLEDARYCDWALRMPSQSLHFQRGKKVRSARYTPVILALEKPRQEDCDLKIRLDYWVRSVQNLCEADSQPMGSLVGLRYLSKNSFYTAVVWMWNSPMCLSTWSSAAGVLLGRLSELWDVEDTDFSEPGFEGYSLLFRSNFLFSDMGY